MLKKRLDGVLLVALVASLVLGACAGVTPTPVPVREAGVTVIVPTEKAETPTPAPTPVIAPRLLRTEPEPGAPLVRRSPIVLVFDQPMDRASTEAALEITPAVAGSLSWDDDRTVRFTPDDEWPPEGRYSILVGEDAESVHGLGLMAEALVELSAVGYLQVARVQPAPDSAEVEVDAPIRVAFNRPVVPLVVDELEASVLEPLRLTPAVAGTGRWVNTALYEFVPERSLQAGARYQVALQEGLVDVLGAPLDEAYAWSFTTSLPRVVAVLPEPGARYVAPQPEIAVAFDQAVVRADAESRFTLADADGRLVACAFQWEGDDTLICVPEQPLTRGAAYTARIAEGVPAQAGGARTELPREWEFRVAALPELGVTTPRDGDEGISMGDQIILRFSCPMSTTTLAAGLEISPNVNYWSYWDDNNTQLTLYGGLDPSTTYTISLNAELRDAWGVPLQEPRTIRFVTGPRPPAVSFDVPDRMGVYDAAGPLTVAVHHVNITRMNLALYRMGADELVAMGGDMGWQVWESYQPAADALVRTWSIETDAQRDAQALLDVPLRAQADEALEPGYYYLQVTAPEASSWDRHVLIVTETNLMLKTAGKEALVWATDIRSGEPVAGVELTAWGRADSIIDDATTDADGLARLDLGGYEPWAPLVVTGDRDGSPSVVMRFWENGLSAWAFDLASERSDQNHLLYLATDRQIYRPGQEVQFKGVLRRDNDAQYALPSAGTSVDVELWDPQGRQILEEGYTLNDMGTFAGSVVLGDAAVLGYYELRAHVGEELYYQVFQVAAYRKPAFEVALGADASDYVQGDTLEASGSSSYFFGGAVAEASVGWRVMAAPYFFDRYQGDRSYTWEDWDLAEPWFGEGRMLSEGAVTSDDNGAFAWELPIDLSELGQSQRLTLEASVTGPDNQEVSARTQAVAHVGDLYVGLAPERYVGTAGERQTVHVAVVDTDGVPLARRSVELVFSQREWLTVQVESPEGYTYWSNEPQDTPVYTATVTTDGQGRAVEAFVPEEGGLFRVVGRARDARGNVVRSAISLWVSDEVFVNWGRENHPRINLVPDRESYAPGDVANILVPLPVRGPAQALLTIERGGVLEEQVFTLEGSSDRIQVRITPDHAPNVFVSVFVTVPAEQDAPGSFFLGYAELPVSAEQQLLELAVAPAETGPYGPRNTVTYDVTTKDWQGQPVDAEVSLALVDRAVEVLAGIEAPDILQTFYRERGLGVDTSTTLARSVDQHNLDRARGEKGGGGAGGMETMVRSDMPDTAYWAPQLRTGEGGRLQVDVTLPDSLTTWRMRAQAVTADTEVGSAYVDVVSTLDLLVQPVVPRFAVVGDAPTLGCLVYNRTAQPVKALVELAAEGIAFEAEPREVNVPANGQVSVTWDARVLPSDRMVLRFSADAGALADAVEVSLPVRPPSAPSVAGTSGEIGATARERIEVVELPTVSDTSMGGLSIEIEPSLVAGLTAPLAYLRDYPYACVEQTVSRFYPELALWEALGSRMTAAESTQVVQRATQALQRLYAEQNLDGGWGWWHGQPSSPALTAYVLQGLAQAQDVDLLVPPDVLERGIGYLQEWLREGKGQPGMTADMEATVLLALAEAGAGDTGRTSALYERRDDLSLSAKAELALAMVLLLPDQTSRLQTLGNDLDAAALLSAAGARWHEEQAGGWRFGSDARTTALVLRALLSLQPDSELIPMAARWLMVARQEGIWATTQENAWAVIALAEYAAGQPEGEPIDGYAIELDGRLVCGGFIDQTGEGVACEVPADELTPGQPSRVRLTTEGGQESAYYSAYLRAYVPADRIEAVSRGITVSRRYALADTPDKPITGARVNDTLIVRLTIVAEHDLYYLVVEDPLPAGCEPIDTSLATTSMAAPWPTLERVMTTLAGSQDWGWYWNWADHTELRDDRAALFAEYLPAGTYEYVYAVRCTTPGSFLALPAEAYEMYFPDTFGRSGGTRVVIRG